MFLNPYSHKEPFSMSELIKRVPAAFAQNASQDVSHKYNFISTEQVINALNEGGFHPYYAMQGRSRKEGKELVAKHVVKFRKEGTQLIRGDLIPEIVLSTSHDGTSAFRLDFGIHRVICSNGLVAPSSFAVSRSVRHKGYNDGDIIDAAFEVLSNCPDVEKNVTEMNKLILTEREREVFAEASLLLKYNDDDIEETLKENFSPTPSLLLVNRRRGDSGKDLFSTFNVIQENLIKGGQLFFGKDKSGFKVKKTTRPVKSVIEDLKLNKALWTLANKMLEIRS
ncbi:DUF932 domain-containing protein [Fluviispira sanaruensis]|uniref:DUF945 domain-containing protein n=1 Tax=Fluviispira sanaruensis TaxID=2493639 RepID=A0A4P2W0G8_FLUSA|nr:DUF932 domain-containing protein [Fluviispira sanaruensis]BBH54662.1 hypothetical protein JCM31447_31360 [Fluviispira sanaruensis]